MQTSPRSLALFHHASMGIVVVNGRGNIVAANAAAETEFGYEGNELEGRRLDILIPARFRDRHEIYQDEYFQHPSVRHMGQGRDLFALHKNGREFPVEISLSYYEENGERFVIAFIVNISARKTAELALQRMHEQLEQTVEQRTEQLKKTLQELQQSSEKLEEALAKEKELNTLKSNFVSMASHEFRTPLSTVLSSVYLIEKYTTEEDQPRREKHIRRIISSVEMLTDILNDFLSVGKIEEGKVQVRISEIDIQKLVSTVVDELKMSFRKDQEINYNHTGDKIVATDGSMFKHIVLNLLSNAIKFTPDHGRINVSTETLAGTLTLIVADNGIGISMQDQKHLMERFFRGTNVTNIQGTGLGLTIVGKYAELLNGTVTYKSELEKGTEFKVVINLPYNEKDTAG